MKEFAVADVEEVTAYVLLKDLIDSSLTSRSFMHLEFIFVYGVREWSSFILLHIAVQYSQHHLLKRLSFFTGCFFLLYQRLVPKELRVHFWVLYSVPLVYVSVFVPVPCCLCDHSFVVQLEIRHCVAPSFVFPFQHFLGDSGPFLVPHKFKGCLFRYRCTRQGPAHLLVIARNSIFRNLTEWHISH